MTLATKIGVALFLVLAAALGMTTVLNYLRFEQTLQTLVTQRINVVSNETSQDLLAGIDLGLRLENMENLGVILDRRLGMSHEVTQIAVQNCQGTPIARSGRNLAKAPTSTIMPPPSDAQGKASWTRFTDQGVISSTPLRDSLGQCAGMLTITADGTDYFGKLDGAFRQMWQSAAIGMLAIIPVLGLLMVLMHRRHRVFSELHEDIERALAGQTPTGTAHDNDVLTESEMELIALYREIRDQLPNDGASSDQNAPAGKST